MHKTIRSLVSRGLTTKRVSRIIVEFGQVSDLADFDTNSQKGDW